MNNTFENLFSQFDYKMSDAVSDGKILKIISCKDNTELTVVASFDKYVKYDEIEQLCIYMRKALALSIFNIECKYTPDKLTQEYFPEIFRFFKDRFPLVNGFFNDADVEITGDDVKVILKRGGYDLLEKNGASKKLSSLIEDMFSRKVNISFDGVLETDEEAYEREQMKFLASLPVASAPANNAPQQSAPKKEDDKSSNIEFRTCTVDFTRLHLLCDNALVLKGSPIDPQTKVTEMKDIPSDFEGNITVWGDVFKCETRETKNGMLIASLFITDYTSSLSVKMVGVLKANKYNPFTKAVLEAVLEKMKAGSTVIISGKIEEDSFDHSVNLNPDSIMLVKRELKKRHE